MKTDENLVKPITLEINRNLWEKFKDRVPRSTRLNDKIVELIKQFLYKK